MAEEERRARVLNGRLGQAKEIMEFVNTAGALTLIGGAVIVLVFGWLTGRIPTPWVTPASFSSFQSENKTFHDDSIAEHKMQTIETKKQTLIQRALLCEHKAEGTPRNECYRDLAIGRDWIP